MNDFSKKHLKPKQRPIIPLLEISLSLFSAYAAVLLLLSPGSLAAAGLALYDNMLNIMPQSWWALSFLVAALIKAVGLVSRNHWLRIVGLGMSTVIYSGIAVCYIFDFPNFGTGLFAIMAFMAFMSIFYVRATDL